MKKCVGFSILQRNMLKSDVNTLFREKDVYLTNFLLHMRKKKFGSLIVIGLYRILKLVR